jgi:hypothetical protein
MALRDEKLGGTAAVKGTMLEAHLEWASQQLAGTLEKLAPLLSAESAGLVKGRILPIQWIPLRCVVEIDRAIATAVGRPPNAVFHELGRHSARFNLQGVYKNYASEDPHAFFEKQTLLHSRFCNFGRPAYEQTGPRSGRITIGDSAEYSPVFCRSAQGYYEAALEVMKVPGPVQVSETACVCLGGPACVFEMSW